LFESSAGDAVRELQFCEMGRGTWRVSLELTAKVDRVPDAIREPIERIVHDAYGDHCNVSMQVVDRIPRKGGKFRYFVQETPA
jgi:hypothetical protein